MLTCTKCKRTRPEKYLVLRKNKYSNKKQVRCRARSVCASIARRKRAN